MPSVSKFTEFDVNVYEVELDNSEQTKLISSMNTIRASFDSPGSAVSQITLYGIQLQPGIAAVGYDIGSKKANVVYIKGNNGLLESPAEVSDLYDSSMVQRLLPLLFQKKSARLFVVSGISMYDGSKLTKLVVTDSFVKLG